VFGIALGYEDLNDHDDLRRDPVVTVLAGKLAARREACAPLAGNRRCSTRCYKIAERRGVSCRENRSATAGTNPAAMAS
jgi:hypothetical protein